MPETEKAADSKRMLQSPCKTKSKITKTGKPRKSRPKKYETPVSEYIYTLKQSVLEGNTSSASVINLSYKDIARDLAKTDSFNSLKIDSIEQGVRRTAAWKNRKETLKEIYNTATFKNRRACNTPYQDVQ